MIRDAALAVGPLARGAAVMTILLAAIILPFVFFGGYFDDLAIALVGKSQDLVGLGGFALLAADIALPVPSSVVATVMGAVLGGWLGTLVNALGLTAGCLIGFLGGSTSTALTRRLLGESAFNAFAAWVGRHGLVAILVCRAVPVLGEASLIVAGAGRARMSGVLATASLANLCLGALYAFVGAAAGPTAVPSLPAVIAAIGVPAMAGIVALWWIRRP